MTILTDPPVAADDRSDAALAELRTAVAGSVHTPSDPDWDQARTPWAVAIDQQPLAVVEVRDAEDVRRAVRWAVDHGYAVTAQPIGHGATVALSQGMANTVLLRTRALNQINVDLTARTATVGAGVKAGELLAALDGTGLTFLAGSNPDPTVIGMTISGGLSWFGRAYGLAANSIVSAELVDGCGRVRRVTRASDPDLFWAIRGGGGDFGILTSLEIALHPGAQLWGGRLYWSDEQMPAVLRAFREVTAKAPDTFTAWYHGYQFPPLPELPEAVRGKSFASVAVGFLGSAADDERLIAPFRAVPGLVMDSTGPLPMSELARLADEPTDPTPSREHSMFLSDLSDETLDALTAVAGHCSKSPLALLQIRHLGGAFARRHPADGAAGHLDQPYLLFAMGVLAVPELGPVLDAAFDRLDSALADHTDGRTVPNFLGSHQDVRQAFPPDTLDRLAAIKRQVDPLNTIRSNRPTTQ